MSLAHSIGAARSLTHVFKRNKQKSLTSAQILAGGNDKERLLGSGGIQEVELIAMPPIWVDRYEEIVEQLEAVSKRGKELVSKGTKGRAEAQISY